MTENVTERGLAVFDEIKRRIALNVKTAEEHGML